MSTPLGGGIDLSALKGPAFAAGQGSPMTMTPPQLEQHLATLKMGLLTPQIEGIILAIEALMQIASHFDLQIAGQLQKLDQGAAARVRELQARCTELEQRLASLEKQPRPVTT